MSSEFNFFQHWYPLTPIEDLDPKSPTSVTVLGIKVVIWKPKSSDIYQVFLDQCPHRLAPSLNGALKNIQLLQIFLLGFFATSVSIVAVLPDAQRQKLGVPLIFLALLGL